MGYQDRDYYREPPSRRSPGMNVTRKPRSAVFIIIALNVAIWLVNAFFFPDRSGLESSRLTNAMCLYADTIFHPLEYYRFITHGFAHSEHIARHIIGNMLVLFFLGPPVEARYGKREFLWFYMLAIIAGGIVWCITTLSSPPLFNPITKETFYPSAVGASGAVTAVVIMFALTYPHARVMLLFPPIPMPAWVLGVGFIIYDIYGANLEGTNVAHTAHLGGAAFAILYFLFRRSFIRLTGGLPGGGVFRDDYGNHYRLRTYRDDSTDSGTTPSRDASFASQQADDREFLALKMKVETILQKIMVSGMDSLTEEEKKTLMDASRKYQDQRR